MVRNAVLSGERPMPKIISLIRVQAKAENEGSESAHGATPDTVGSRRGTQSDGWSCGGNRGIEKRSESSAPPRAGGDVGDPPELNPHGELRPSKIGEALHSPYTHV